MARTFGIPRDAAVTALTSGVSDPHGGGRHVVVVGFDRDMRLVYKPRPMEIEARYQVLVATISSHLYGDPLRRLTVLPREGYGYVEHVASEAADGAAAMTSFYRNAGRILAILYLVGATDCHWENMIAVGEHLVLIDAETLFEGVPRPATDHLDTATSSAASDSIANSVLRTGMLPAWISVGPRASIDLTALGVPGPETEGSRAPAWCFVNTDDMVWGERDIASRQPPCLPVSRGEPNPLSTHAEELLAGFEELIAVLRRPVVRDEVRVCLQAFRGVRRRVVIRATRTYVLLQAQALALGALRDPDARALQLERLARAYIGEQEQPATWRLLEHEIAALEDLDVPYFEGVVGRPDVLVRGEVVIDAHYEREGLDEALQRLDRLTDAETRWQGRLIRGAIAAHRFQMGATAEGEPSYIPLCADPPSADWRNHDARDVAKLIAADVLADPSGPPTWLTVALLTDATRVQLGLVPPGLYDGRAGIAAFLYDCDEREFADGVLRPVLEALDDDDPAQVRRFLQNIGLGLAGAGGLLRLFHYLTGANGMQSGWDERASRTIAALSDELLGADATSDLVSGIAGLAAPVAAFHRTTPTQASGRVLATIGKLLLDRQDDIGGWALGFGHPALLGLSHGASGIAVALAEIAVALEDDRYADAAARGLRFEGRHFDPATCNWPDLRKGLGQNDRLAMRSWCHGAVGVALARLRMSELLHHHSDAPRWSDELSTAIGGSIGAPLSPMDHLCCGNIGRAVVISMAGQSTGNAEWQAEGVRISGQVATRARHRPEEYRLLLGIAGTSGLRLPGLMTGLAGIGMHMLHGRDLRWARCLLV